MRAAEIASGGGKEGLTNYLAARAIETPGPLLALLGKVLPLQIGPENPNEPLVVEIVKRFYPDDKRQLAMRETDYQTLSA